MFQFYNEIINKYGGLLKTTGFEIMYFECNNRCFGNCIFEFESNILKLRFIKDRDQISIDIDEKNHNSWVELNNVINFFRKSKLLINDHSEDIFILCSNIELFNTNFSKKNYNDFLSKLNLNE